MAINFLPIILVGAAAAVFASGRKKKGPHTKACQAKITVANDVLKRAFDSAKAMSKDSVEAATHTFSAIVPPPCTRSDASSSIDIIFSAISKMNDFERSVTFTVTYTLPEFYMMILGEFSEDMDGGSAFGDAIPWYTSTTGMPLGDLEKRYHDAMDRATGVI
jgi:hypothetical protein